jgi:hypothetical protein
MVCLRLVELSFGRSPGERPGAAMRAELLDLAEARRIVS